MSACLHCAIALQSVARTSWVSGTAPLVVVLVGIVLCPTGCHRAAATIARPFRQGFSAGLSDVELSRELVAGDPRAAFQMSFRCPAPLEYCAWRGGCAGFGAAAAAGCVTQCEAHFCTASQNGGSTFFASALRSEAETPSATLVRKEATSLSLHVRPDALSPDFPTTVNS